MDPVAVVEKLGWPSGDVCGGSRGGGSARFDWVAIASAAEPRKAGRHGLDWVDRKRGGSAAGRHGLIAAIAARRSRRGGSVSMVTLLLPSGLVASGGGGVQCKPGNGASTVSVWR